MLPMALALARDIYAGLANRPWPYLRHEQGEVLDEWFDHGREDRDAAMQRCSDAAMQRSSRTPVAARLPSGC
jgi:hypothetical protein